MNIDPRLLGVTPANGRAAQPARGDYGVDAQARAEIEKLKQFIATRVGNDVQLLTKAISDLNGGVEQAIAAIMARLNAIEKAISGGTIQPDPSGMTVEAANVQPGDENLPPEYFQGAEEEIAP